MPRGFFNFFALFIVVAFLAVGTLIIDAVSCDVELVFTCNNHGDKGGGGGHPIPPVTTPTTGKPGKGGTSTSTTSGPISTPCLSTTTNACGMHGNGFMVAGSCNAVAPANNSCPAPVISAATGFYADPALIRATNQAILHWSVTNATSCGITGGGLNLTSLGILGSTQTAPITTKTVFTLTCQNGVDGPKSSSNTTVNLVPAFQEN